MAQSDFTNLPRYQRAVQRLRRVSPDRLAILDTAAIDAAFAEEDMRSKIRDLTLATRKQSQDTSVAHAEKTLGLNERSLSLSKSVSEASRDKEKMANIIGAAQIPVAGISGYLKIKEADEQKALLERLAGLYRKPGLTKE